MNTQVWRCVFLFDDLFGFLGEEHDVPFKYVPFDLASQKDLQYRIGTPLAEKPSHHRSPLVGN